MQPAVHAKQPIRLILEVQASELQGLVLQILERFTMRATAAPLRPEPDPDDDEDDDAPEERTADPPPGRVSSGQAAPVKNVTPAVAPLPPMPTLPPHVRRTRFLGRPCKHGHVYKGSGYALRKKSNHGCVECERERDLAHKKRAVRPPAPVTPRAPVLAPLQDTRSERPTLPPHWEGRGFLSSVVCSNPAHRFQGSPFTLRYTQTELCVHCCTAEQPALAGD